MTLRFGSIIIHKPDPNSETDTGNTSNSDYDEEPEIAEIAETAILKYQWQLKSGGYKSKKQTLTQRRAERLNKRNMLASTKYRNAIIEGRDRLPQNSVTKEVPLLRVLHSDKSPPLNHSRYHSAEEQLSSEKESVSNFHTRRSSISSTSTEDSNHSDSTGADRLGFRVLTLGSRSSTDHRRVSSVSTMSTDASSTRRSKAVLPIVSHQLVEEESEVKGLAKLLKNLNFAEKLRQQKAEQERLNIHKLPNNMREQLKHIYVY